MATPSLVRRIGDKAKDYVSGVRALPPNESEFAGIRAAEQNVNEATPSDSAASKSTPPSSVAPQDKVNPKARYGDRPGEMRPEQVLAPLYDDGGDVSHNNMERMMAVPLGHTNVGAQPVPEYTGGDAQAKPKPKPTSPYGVGGGSDPGLAHPAYMPGGEPTPEAPAMPTMPMPTGASVPNGDKGGRVPLMDTSNVDVNDGQHQVAILKEGEKVLTPEQARMHDLEHPETRSALAVPAGLTPMTAPKAAGDHTDMHEMPLFDNGGDVHGAPADFGGRVLSNPNGIRPMLDTEIPMQAGPSEYPGGVKPDIRNAPLGRFEMAPMGKAAHQAQRHERMEAPAMPGVPVPHELQSSPLKVYDEGGDVVADDPSKKPQPMGAPEQAQAAPKEPKLDPNSPAGQIVNQDKMQAAQKGTAGVADLATAKLHEKALAAPKMEEGAQAPPGMNQGGPAQGAMAAGATSPFPKSMAVGAQPGAMAPGAQMPAQPQAGPQANPAGPAGLPAPPEPPLSHKARVADYDSKILAAMDMAAKTNDPVFSEQADRLKLAKAEYLKQTPWGSATNHPGILGEIGHVAAKAGNIAGNLFAAPEMALIPGTDLYKQRQAGINAAQLKSDEAASLANKELQYKNKVLETGKDINTRTYNWLLGQTNPKTGKPYTNDEALNEVKEDANTKAEHEYEASLMHGDQGMNPVTGKPYTQAEATEAYYKMKAAQKPPSAEQKQVEDYILAHPKEYPDGLTAPNRDAARNEIQRRKTDTQQSAKLPYDIYRAKLNADLARTTQELAQTNADANTYAKAADEAQQKVDAVHFQHNQQLTTAYNALNQSDTNMLAASILPVLTTMTASNMENIKRLNPIEFSKFDPKTSGDFPQWLAAHWDKFTEGQNPDIYKQNVKALLDQMQRDEDSQYQTSTQAVDKNLGQHGRVPVVAPSGKTAGSAPRQPNAPLTAPPKGTTHTGRGSADHLLHYLDANGKDLGVAAEPKKK